WLETLRSQMPVLPEEWRRKFIKEYNLPEYDAGVLTDNREVAEYFDNLCQHTKNYKSASNWLMGPVKSYLNDNKVDMAKFPLGPEKIAELITLIDNKKVSYSSASQLLFPEWIKNPEQDAEKIAEKLNLIQESDEDSLSAIVEEVVASFPDKVKAYRNGKKGLIGMFMGEVMKAT